MRGDGGGSIMINLMERGGVNTERGQSELWGIG